MATLNFPTSPFLNQQYSFGNNAWFWDGYGWQLVAGKPGNSQFVPIAPRVVQCVADPNHAEPLDGVAVSVLILTSQNNVNIFTAAGSPSAAVNLLVVVPSGVTIGSASAGTGSANAAMYTGTGWASGSVIRISGAGTIVGLDGAGGASASAGQAGNAGGTGSDALYMAWPVTLLNFTGIIAGGPGGGGSGGGGSATSSGSGGAGATAVASGGSAGVAGSGTGAGAAGSSGTAHASAGGAGGNSTGVGSGGGGGGGGVGYGGGAGGTGNNGANAGGAAGTAGYAIRKNGYTLTGSATTTYGTVG